ncbi:hypothetical protein KFU94_09410 [Chloroflexi bacterium TSY]|nr:hypothetical protein [Chloroflexi bacterium TSY]
MVQSYRNRRIKLLPTTLIASFLVAGCLLTLDPSVSSINRTAPQQAWVVGYGTNQGEHVIEGVQTADNGYIAVGKTYESTGSAADILIVKTDADGVLEWQRALGHQAGQSGPNGLDPYLCPRRARRNSEH